VNRLVFATLLLTLSACATGNQVVLPEPGPGPGPVPDPGPVPYAAPLTGQIAYACDNGSQLVVDFENNQARVAIVGGPSMVLPSAGEGYYSNGRYGIRGSGADAQWQAGAGAPVHCRGS
jgi:hypothetical protein